MTIVGKILVILVFLMSLVAAGFFAIDYATRTNWKAAYDTLANEMKVVIANQAATPGTTGALHRDASKYRAERDEARQTNIDQEKLSKAMEASYKVQIEEANNKASDAELSNQKILAQMDRLKNEIKDLFETVKKREAFILILEKDTQKYRTEAVANENLAKAMQARNETLLAQVQEQLRMLATLQTGGKGTDGGGKDPNALNPPANFVRGTITKIHAEDRTLVEISLGSDQGVNKNHTLEVYRLQPKAEYLGTIRILDARHHNSVGRLLRASATTVRQLQEGDIVASSISANK